MPACVTRSTFRRGLHTWTANGGLGPAGWRDFPSLSWLANTQEDALAGMRELVHDVVEDLQSSGEEIPEPLSERSYSGKFNLRVGERLHRKLAMKAADEQLSLNQYVVRRLSTAS